jgi:hypothetical protein
LRLNATGPSSLSISRTWNLFSDKKVLKEQTKKPSGDAGQVLIDSADGESAIARNWLSVSAMGEKS